LDCTAKKVQDFDENIAAMSPTNNDGPGTKVT
jgi:hypothetical protein